jgi:hypothetical protein
MRQVQRLGVIALGAMLIISFVAADVLAGPRDHMDGFFMRLSAGGGAAKTEITYQGDTEEFSGATGDLNIALGGIVSPNLAIHGTVWGWTLTSPDYTFNNVTVQSVDADVTMVAIGAGLTYYFMPSNFYLSGSVGVGTLSLDAGAITFETDAGAVLDLTLGKEWWVGRRWGLGAAAGFSYHAIPDGGVDENWKGPGFGIRFSATYN